MGAYVFRQAWGIARCWRCVRSGIADPVFHCPCSYRVRSHRLPQTAITQRKPVGETETRGSADMANRQDAMRYGRRALRAGMIEATSDTTAAAKDADRR